MANFTIPDGFHLVYQGGHHNVYCNKTTHLQTNGGHTLIVEPSEVWGSYPCDCEKWQSTEWASGQLKQTIGLSQ